MSQYVRLAALAGRLAPFAHTAPSNSSTKPAARAGGRADERHRRPA